MLYGNSDFGYSSSYWIVDCRCYCAKQRVSKLQEQLNEALKNQVNLRQQVLNLADNVLKSAEHIKTLTDNVKRIVDVVHEHINSSDDK